MKKESAIKLSVALYFVTERVAEAETGFFSPSVERI